MVKPEERVIIPQGGGRSVSCQYSDNPDPPPLIQNVVVDWFKDLTTLRGTPPPMTMCFCVASAGRPLNLTFVDFQADGAGMYNCGAQTSGLNFDRCHFMVLLAGKGECVE